MFLKVLDGIKIAASVTLLKLLISVPFNGVTKLNLKLAPLRELILPHSGLERVN
jgi:hypothetical protein